uniref:EGF-like domain-containing protein n=1 Tax=Syphacia muris TaxID=451379 RepID=A0A0N5AEE5_9BILA
MAKNNFCDSVYVSVVDARNTRANLACSYIWGRQNNPTLNYEYTLSSKGAFSKQTCSETDENHILCSYTQEYNKDLNDTYYYRTATSPVRQQFTKEVSYGKEAELTDPVVAILSQLMVETEPQLPLTVNPQTVIKPTSKVVIKTTSKIPVYQNTPTIISPEAVTPLTIQTAKNDGQERNEDIANEALETPTPKSKGTTTPDTGIFPYSENSTTSYVLYLHITATVYNASFLEYVVNCSLRDSATTTTSSTSATSFKTFESTYSRRTPSVGVEVYLTTTVASAKSEEQPQSQQYFDKTSTVTAFVADSSEMGAITSAKFTPEKPNILTSTSDNILQLFSSQAPAKYLTTVVSSQTNQTFTKVFEILTSPKADATTHSAPFQPRLSTFYSILTSGVDNSETIAPTSKKLLQATTMLEPFSAANVMTKMPLETNENGLASTEEVLWNKPSTIFEKQLPELTSKKSSIATTRKQTTDVKVTYSEKVEVIPTTEFVIPIHGSSMLTKSAHLPKTTYLQASKTHASASDLSVTTAPKYLHSDVTASTESVVQQSDTYEKISGGWKSTQQIAFDQTESTETQSKTKTILVNELRSTEVKHTSSPTSATKSRSQQPDSYSSSNVFKTSGVAFENALTSSLSPFSTEQRSTSTGARTFGYTESNVLSTSMRVQTSSKRLEENRSVEAGSDTSLTSSVALSTTTGKFLNEKPTLELIFVRADTTTEYKKTRLVKIINLTASNYYYRSVYKTISSTQPIANITAICKMTKYCNKPKCDFSVFKNENVNQRYLQLPAEESIDIGEKASLQCTADPDQPKKIVYYCNADGAFDPHPSEQLCQPKKDEGKTEIEDPIEDSSLEYGVQTCDECSDRGTENCTKLQVGYQCICKDGWTASTCWKSPRYCSRIQCGEHGKCVEKVDYAECECKDGWSGSTCTVNVTNLLSYAAESADGEAKKMVFHFYQNQYTLASLVTSASIALLLHIFLFNDVDDEADYPHEMFQCHRVRALVLGSLCCFLFRNPSFLQLDSKYGTRVYNFVINVSFCIGQCFYGAEAYNALKLICGEYINAWDRGLENDQQMKYMAKFYVCLLWHSTDTDLRTVANKLELYFEFMDNVRKLGAFDYQLQHFFSFTECNNTVLHSGLHTKTVKFFIDQLPYELGRRMVPVERSRLYTAVGSVLHYFTWLFVHQSTCNLSSNFYSMQMCSVNDRQLQYFHSDTNNRNVISVTALMLILPKSMAPKYEYHEMNDRIEVIAKWSSSRFKNEQLSEALKLKKALQKNNEAISQRNKNLANKLGSLPEALTIYPSEISSEISIPIPFVAADCPTYISNFHRQMMCREWSDLYFAKRSRGFSTDESFKSTRKNLFDYDEYEEGKLSERIFVWDQWFNNAENNEKFKDQQKACKVNEEKMKLLECNLTSAPEAEIKVIQCDDETLPVLIVKNPPVFLEQQDIQSESMENTGVGRPSSVIQANPRKHPLNEFWLDSSRPGFEGPLNKSFYDNAAFHYDLKTLKFLQEALESQWNDVFNKSLEAKLCRQCLRDNAMVDVVNSVL